MCLFSVAIVTSTSGPLLLTATRTPPTRYPRGDMQEGQGPPCYPRHRPKKQKGVTHGYVSLNILEAYFSNILDCKYICGKLITKEDDTMKSNEVIKAIMELVGVKPSVLAARLNLKSNAMSGRFKMENISIVKMNEMLRAMDYKLVAVPRETRIPDGGFEVE